MINIKNSQRKIKVDLDRVRRHVKKMLDLVGYSDFDIGIWFTTNQTIRTYNKKFRRKDASTDILSFPYHTDLEPGQKVIINEPEDKNLGDIIISLEYVKKDCLDQNCSFSDRLDILLAHGIAHLLGHQHETENEYKQMQKLERRLLEGL